MKLIIRSDSVGCIPKLFTEQGDEIEGVKGIELIIDDHGQDVEPPTAKIVFYISELEVIFSTGD